MKNLLASSLVLAALVTSAVAVQADPGDQLDKRGDRIDERLDKRGERINDRLDRRSDRAADAGREGRAEHLDERGDRIEGRMDKRGDRINNRMDRRAQRRSGGFSWAVIRVLPSVRMRYQALLASRPVVACKC